MAKQNRYVCFGPPFGLGVSAGERTEPHEAWKTWSVSSYRQARAPSEEKGSLYVPKMAGIRTMAAVVIGSGVRGQLADDPISGADQFEKKNEIAIAQIVVDGTRDTCKRKGEPTVEPVKSWPEQK